uniref:DHC_N1 domain-containing protein n=1 Tax=Rodentolepis nana TaxID=102285 RepID=A0A0R3TGV7_RODNA
LAPSPVTQLTTTSNTEPVEQGVPSLEQIETVWLDLRRLQQEITETFRDIIRCFSPPILAYRVIISHLSVLVSIVVVNEREYTGHGVA